METNRTIAEIFELASRSEKTLIKRGFYIAGYHLINDMGHACEYRVVDVRPCEIGMIKYYKGRKLAYYKKVTAE